MLCFFCKKAITYLLKYLVFGTKTFILPLMTTFQEIIPIFFYSFLTAIACGIGALPFFWWRNISQQGIGIAKSIAA